MAAPDQSERFPWARVATAAYLPTAAFGIGQGAIIPYIPIVAGELGASLSVAAVVAAMLTIGLLIGDLPGGSLVARFGERPTMIAASVVSLGALVLAWLSTELWMLALAIVILGLASAIFGIARHAFLTTYVPIRFRARALSTLGGIHRLGAFLGPLLASLVLGLGAPLASVWLICAAGAVVAIVVLLLLPDPQSAFEHLPATTGSIEAVAERTGLLQVFRSRGGLLATVGLGAAMLSLARQARNVLLPLWAVSIGVDQATTGLVIGLAGGIDFALFFISGLLMDRFGRMIAIVPSLGLLAVGFGILAISHDWTATFVWFVVGAVVIGVGNGLSSGILLTLGADLADRRNPAPFLGAWRLTTDLGGAAAPVLIAALVQLASIVWAAAGLVVTCLAGMALLVRFLPRYSPRR